MAFKLDYTGLGQWIDNADDALTFVVNYYHLQTKRSQSITWLLLKTDVAYKYDFEGGSRDYRNIPAGLKSYEFI